MRTKILRHVGIATDDSEVQKLKDLAYEIIVKMKLEEEQKSSQKQLFDSHSQEELAENLKARGRKKAKKIEDIAPVDNVCLIDIVEQKRIVEGVSDIAGPVYDELGFNTLLKSKKEKKLLKDLVLTRLVAPRSKHKLQKILLEQFDQHHHLTSIYQMMDRLHTSIDTIKTLVFKSTQTLFPGGINLLLFDVTTLYFESINEDGLREFGYSKDFRFNTTQVVLALATNEDGLPLGYELFRGDTAEVKTLCEAIDKWKTHLPIQGVCFVGDRAMFCEKNLGILEEKGYSYVVAAKLRALNAQTQEKILNEKNYQPGISIDTFGFFAEFDHSGRRLITSYKTQRAVHDCQKRQKILDKITKNLEDKKDLGKNSGIKKYTKTLGKSQTVLDQEKVDRDAQWDGMHGVITNIKDEPIQDILARYARLWVIEESFRINKHNLKMRPIYHFKTERIETHIAMCYMTFAVLRHLQYKTKLAQKLSPDEIMEELLNVQASIYIHKKTGDRYRIPGHTTHKASKIYRAFGLIRSQDATVYL